MDAWGERSGFAADAYEPSGIGTDIIEDGLEFAGVVRIGGAVGFDLNGNATSSPVEDEVGFLAGGGAPEEEPVEGMGEAFATDEVFDHETLQDSSCNRCSAKRFQFMNAD